MDAPSTTQTIRTDRPSLMVLDAVTPAHAPERWPIAAGLPQLPAVLPDGTSTLDADAETWAAILAPVVAEGFTAIEVPSTFIRFGDLSPARFLELRQVLDGLGLDLVGLSVARQSIAQPGAERENLAAHHRAIDAAATAEVPILCVGLSEPITQAQRDELWFWDGGGPTPRTSPDEYRAIVHGFRELATHAHEVGISLSLEMYEDSAIGTAAQCLRILEDIGADNVGLNPDIGNLLRLNRPVDTWESMLADMLPHTNYWHVKSYTRTALRDGQFATAPAPLELGIIDYRSALRYAVAQGFAGPLVVEHYGGDGIRLSARNRDYLRSVLPA